MGEEPDICFRSFFEAPVVAKFRTLFKTTSRARTTCALLTNSSSPRDPTDDAKALRYDISPDPHCAAKLLRISGESAARPQAGVFQSGTTNPTKEASCRGETYHQDDLHLDCCQFGCAVELSAYCSHRGGFS